MFIFNILLLKQIEFVYFLNSFKIEVLKFNIFILATRQVSYVSSTKSTIELTM